MKFALGLALVGCVSARTQFGAKALGVGDRIEPGMITFDYGFPPSKVGTLSPSPPPPTMAVNFKKGALLLRAVASAAASKVNGAGGNLGLECGRIVQLFVNCG